VAEKLGAHFEGILKARLRLRGKGGDALGYSLLADEFKSHDWSV
jgi:RimJ/RimL family protein N-acetyltransferase